ncbi:MAG: iron-containing alcohol dehydrogenase, partial [Gammaproteobacteria bacterium]|nr:iron-containing alcohol dehydrogenase [Gammaproteobacteria bacterium]
SLSVYWRAVMNLGAVDPNPLVEGDRLQAYRLAARALPRVADGEDLDARIELCAAAFLQNRDHDVGGLSVRPHWVARVVYAFATALFNRFPHISQGQANAALTPTVMRHLGERDPESLCRLGEGIGAWSPGMPEADAPLRAADQLEQLFGSLGFAARLRDLEVPQSAVLELLEDSMKNFNADPKREFLTHREVLHETLQACW